MLNLSEVAQWLTEVFNEQGKNVDPIYTFNIYAEVGEDKNNVDVQGVLKVDIPKNVPVNGIVNARYYGDIDFTVSAPRSNYNLANVETIIGKVAKIINGTEKVFENGKGFVTMSVAGTGNFKTEYSQGNIVPLKVKLDINYSENVVTGGGKHWYIKELIGDYVEIPFLTERVTVEKDGKISPINDRAYKQAFMLAQQRSYMFTLPYDTTVGALITRDILKGDANKNYKLKYIDGVAFTEDDPFETQVVLYRNGDNGETKPDTAMLNIIFTDADDGSNETKYSLALIDNEFDGTSENTRWFDSIADQQAWFTTKIANGANYDSIDAPNLNNLVLTNQIYKNTRGYDIFDLVNKNYAVIKVIKGENEPQYYYYRVTNADIGANGQVIYTLRLDGVQTWLFRDNLIVDDSFISKAHLNRWIDNGDGSVSFNGNADSKLFEREEIRNVAKRLVSREKLKYDTDIPEMKDMFNFLNDNVLCWLYVTISKNEYFFGSSTIKFTPNSTKTGEWYQRNYRTNVNILDYGVVNLCFPIMKKTENLIEFVFGDINVIWTTSALERFIKSNGGYSYIKSMRLSLKPPFYFNSEIISSGTKILPTYSIEEDEIQSILKFTTQQPETTDNYKPHYLTNGTYPILSNGVEICIDTSATGIVAGAFGCLILNFDNPEETLLSLDNIMPKIQFQKNSIISSAKNKTFNPKLNSADFKTLNLNFMGSNFELDIQKINSEKVVFKFTEMITPDITKFIVRLGTVSDNNIFNEYYASSVNGFIVTNDLSLPISNDVFDTYLANNKNAYLSFQAQQDYARESASMTAQYKTINYGISMGNQTANLGKQLATLNFGGAISTGQQMGVETAQYLSQISELNDRTNLNLNYNKTQFDLSMDNMKNAPETLSNANGNAVFSFALKLGIYAEIQEGLDTELESANDMMFRDGYNLNRFEESGKSIRDYCHTRKYFNYIKATLGNIHGVPMSDTMRADLKERFANGIRFWHQDTIDYSMENYELNLVTE